MLLSQALARQLPDGQTGLIVNLLDQKLYNLNPDFLTYTLSKVGLQGLTRLLAQAFAPRLRVAGIAPGLTLRSGSQTDARFAEQHVVSHRAWSSPTTTASCRSTTSSLRSAAVPSRCGSTIGTQRARMRRRAWCAGQPEATEWAVGTRTSSRPWATRPSYASTVWRRPASSST
jgi:NAD(P)-dependent dehydrogenase (short-subunit alcohol dehydrogenase family)